MRRHASQRCGLAAVRACGARCSSVRQASVNSVPLVISSLWEPGVIAVLEATDQDGPAGGVTFGLEAVAYPSMDLAAQFDIDPGTGSLRLLARVPPGARAYTLRLNVTDAGQPPQSSTVVLQLAVEHFVAPLDATAIEMRWNAAPAVPPGFEAHRVLIRQPAKCDAVYGAGFQCATSEVQVYEGSAARRLQISSLVPASLWVAPQAPPCWL